MERPLIILQPALDFSAHTIPLALLKAVAAVPVVLFFTEGASLRIIGISSQHFGDKLIDLSSGEKAGADYAFPQLPAERDDDRTHRERDQYPACDMEHEVHG
jgi:hypothetical protein